ncbi:MAG: BACON domain-containing protein [Bacteroidales bacterium]|nr:BACON domain-containing protein [Bacteroidales bacterium]
MRINRLIAILATAASVLISSACGGSNKETDPDNGSTSVKDPTIFRATALQTSFSPEVQSTTVTVTCDVKWSISSDASWLSFTPSSGSASASGQEVSANFSFNKDDKPRTAHVTVKAGSQTISLTLTQKAITEMLPETEVYLIKKDITKFLVITKNEWKASIPQADESWLHMEPKSGMGNVSIYFQANDENENVGDRKSTLTITMGSDHIDIPIIQKQKNVLLMADDFFRRDWQAGTFEVASNTNVDFTVTVPSDASAWLKHMSTKALNSKKTTFQIEQNQEPTPRTAVVSFSFGDDINETLTIEQAPFHTVISKADAGIYGADGKDYTYVPGQWQVSKLKNTSTLGLRLLSPKDVKVVEVTGIPADAAFGTTFKANMLVREGRDVTYSANSDAYVLQADDSKISFVTADGVGAIIKK